MFGEIENMFGCCGLSADPAQPGPWAGGYVYPQQPQQSPWPAFALDNPSGTSVKPGDVSSWITALTGGATQVANTVQTIRGGKPPVVPQPSGKSNTLLYVGAIALVGIGAMVVFGGKNKK